MNHKELEMCIRTYGKDIYSFCCHLTQNRQEADDLYQDTFLTAIELLDRLDAGRNPKSCLLSVAVNQWRNRKRKFAWRRRITGTQVSIDDMEAELPMVQETVEEAMIFQEEARMVRKAVAALPEKYKLPVLLFYMEDLKVAEIAAVLKLPQGTVKSRLFQARKVLQKELEVVLSET